MMIEPGAVRPLMITWRSPPGERNDLDVGVRGELTQVTDDVVVGHVREPDVQQDDVRPEHRSEAEPQPHRFVTNWTS